MCWPYQVIGGLVVSFAVSTWTAYRNKYWAALYLIDATGTVRSIRFGEGDYQQTETLTFNIKEKDATWSWAVPAN